MKKILITGGGGFIGRNLKEQLVNEYQVVALSHCDLDLLNTEEVGDFLRKYSFDVVIHSAVHDPTRNSKKDPGLILKNNLLMFYNLARYSKMFGRMIYFGSGAEYDKERCSSPTREDDLGIYIPIDDYGLSKYICAKAAEQSNNIYDLVLFGCFGKYEDWEIRFISNACCKAVFDMDITMKQNAIFDYLYIDDLVRIVKWFLEVDELKYKRYNVCSGSPVSLLTLAAKVKNISGKNINILANWDGVKKEYVGDNSRLIQEMGGFEFADIDRSIQDIYKWYEINKGGIDKNLLLFDK